MLLTQIGHSANHGVSAQKQVGNETSKDGDTLEAFSQHRFTGKMIHYIYEHDLQTRKYRVIKPP